MTTRTKKFLKEINKTAFSFGVLLASLRKADEVTQVELADKVGVSKGLICDIEKGRRNASLELATQIANALGYPKEPVIKQIFEDQLREAKLKLKVKLEAA
jgi:DNA-binding XRE family transcriptional regulator